MPTSWVLIYSLIYLNATIMATYLVKPNFNRLDRQLAFPSKKLNLYMRAELQDNFGFYQSNFGLYSYMTLNKKQKYVLHTMQGTPLLWQPHRSCAWTPTGSLSMSKREFEPCEAKINEEFCYDELFDSCFEPFLNWTGRGQVSLDDAGIGLVNDMVAVLGQNADLGARATLTAGQLFDPAVVKFHSRAAKNIPALFEKTAGTCKGWVELARELGENPQYSHLNVKGIFDEDKFNGGKYTGDIISDIYDELLANASVEMMSLINEGGIVSSVQGDFMPLFVVSLSLYNRVAAMYREQCNPANTVLACANPRLTRQQMSMPTSRGPKNVNVYYIDDVPVIPLSDLATYDKYLTGTMHFAGIIASGNIGLGTSFGALPDVQGPTDVGIIIERESSVKDMGKYYFASHSLFAATIADHAYMVATQAYMVDAE